MTTQTQYRRKLIEVDLPLDDINRESAREKSIRHGHPSTLHLWWARRPLAACRAVIFGSMVDDPSGCPDEFPDEETQHKERERLHGIIKRLVKWKNTDESRPDVKALMAKRVTKLLDRSHALEAKSHLPIRLKCCDTLMTGLCPSTIRSRAVAPYPLKRNGSGCARLPPISIPSLF